MKGSRVVRQTVDSSTVELTPGVIELLKYWTGMKLIASWTEVN